jgi:putative FmdB family regulatory protein
MPIYEYQCQDCTTTFDVFVRSISKKVEAVCPTCGSTHTRKGVSTFASKNAGGVSGSRAASSADCGPSF